MGDCMRAALASLLELDLDAVPHFAEICIGHFDVETFWQMIGCWLRRRDLRLYFHEPLTLTEMRKRGWINHHHLLMGRCLHRGEEIGHALIGLNGVTVHDPDHTKPKLIHGVEWHGFVLDQTGAPFRAGK